MKKTIFFTVCLSALITFSASAKIWRVNNNSTIPADFTSIQAAHDGAMANDTLHIEPSGISYGNLTMTKKLTIIGNGFFLNENYNNQANLNRSIVNNILMRNGCSGSTIMGLVIDNINFQNGDCSGPCIAFITNNIIIERNYFTGAYLDPYHANQSISFENKGYVVGELANLIIRNNYIEGSISQPCSFNGCGNNSYYNISNLLISNNFVKQKISLINSTNCLTSGVVSNNILGDQNNNNGGGFNGCGLIVKNNIFNDTYNSSVGGDLFMIINNLSSSPTGFPAGVGNGNISGVDNATIFKGLIGNTTDSQWQLKAGSPAIGSGQNGEDCGMFGGTNPYKLSGLPAVPSVYVLSAPVNSSGNTLPIIISAKSN
jgi:hypothetical protein